MLSSIALLFFALATSVAVPMPGVPETELRPLADVEEARCLAWRGGEWGRLPTPSDLVSKFLVVELSTILIFRLIEAWSN